MTPYTTASLHVGTWVANVAANGSIRSGGSHPNRIPAPAMTARTASRATHHQSYAVNAPSPAATATPGARYSIRRVPPIDLGSDNAEQQPDDHRVGTELPDECVDQHHGQDYSHQYGGEYMDDAPGVRRLSRVRFTRGGVLRSLDVLSLTHPGPPFHGVAQQRPPY